MPDTNSYHEYLDQAKPTDYLGMVAHLESAVASLEDALQVARRRVAMYRHNPTALEQAREDREIIRTALKTLGARWACAEHIR